MSGSTVATTGCGALIQDQHYSTVGSRPGLKREEGGCTKRPRPSTRIRAHVLYVLGVGVVHARTEFNAQKHKFEDSVNKIVTETYADAITDTSHLCTYTPKSVNLLFLTSLHIHGSH